MMGEKVTLKTLIDPREEFSAIAWFFNDGSGLKRVVTVTRGFESVVSEDYQGSATVNQTNGFLTLGPLAAKDDGEYYVNVFTSKGVKTGETKLRVLGEIP